MAAQLTVYQQHKMRWKDGCGSQCCDLATRVCLARGKLPCDMLFVGEAPGQSEDSIGAPFTGPAGQLLDQILSDVIHTKAEADRITDATGRPCPAYRAAFTNVVGCIPLESDGSGKSSEPSDDQVTQCQPRLKEFIDEVARPRLIVTVGKIAHEWLDPQYKHGLKLKDKIPQVTILHPAYILRRPMHEHTPLMNRVRINLRDAIEKYLK